MREVTKLLESHELEPNPVGLFVLESGIELREYAKFQFTRNLSDILELIADFGKSLNRQGGYGVFGHQCLQGTLYFKFKPSR